MGDVIDSETINKACRFKKSTVLNKKEVKEYYEYLLNSFKNEFHGISNRRIIEDIASKGTFSKKERKFLMNVVKNGFQRKNIYKKRDIKKHKYYHPIELLDFIVSEGYIPNSPFVKWAHKKLGVSWNLQHWFRRIMRDIAQVDASKIRKNTKQMKNFELPETLELYYKTGTGVECLNPDPEKGIKYIVEKTYKDREKYVGFDPMDYLDYYYGWLDEEDMIITKVLYSLILKNRKKLRKSSNVLIIGNGPIPDDAQTLAMVPEVKKIIPSDIDPRNIRIMSGHTGGKNPLTTRKTRPGEEHADFLYYLFEKHNKINWGLFPVREITSIKTIDPVYVDISKNKPLDMPQNSRDIKNLKADLIMVPFCPESITNSMKKYKRYMKNISNLVLPKKHLCMLALKEAKYYKSGKKRLKALSINEEIVCGELFKNGFENIEIITIEMNLKDTRRGFSDSMIVWADKKER